MIRSSGFVLPAVIVVSAAGGCGATLDVVRGPLSTSMKTCPPSDSMKPYYLVMMLIGLRTCRQDASAEGDL